MAGYSSQEQRRKEKQAYQDGMRAKQYGELIEVCPYKPSELGLYFHWMCGWDAGVVGDVWQPKT